MQGTREYNVGDAPDIAAQGAAQQMGIELPADFQARQINPERDIVEFDIVLVMDKFTAADVLREVCAHCDTPCLLLLACTAAASSTVYSSSKQQSVIDLSSFGCAYSLLTGL